MKTSELRKKSVKELHDMLKKERSSIAAFDFHSAKGRSKNVKAKQTSRRSVARILTLLNEQKP